VKNEGMAEALQFKFTFEVLYGSPHISVKPVETVRGPENPDRRISVRADPGDRITFDPREADDGTTVGSTMRATLTLATLGRSEVA
jgi:hypothetical protein